MGELDKSASLLSELLDQGFKSNGDLKGELFYKLCLQDDQQMSYKRNEIHIDYVNAKMPDCTKAIRVTLPSSDAAEESYKVDLKTSLLKAEASIECDDISKLLELVSDLVNLNNEPCSGISPDNINMDCTPTTLADILKSVCVEEQFSSGLVRVRSRLCQIFGSSDQFNRDDSGNYVCDQCLALTGVKKKTEKKIEQVEEIGQDGEDQPLKKKRGRKGKRRRPIESVKEDSLHEDVNVKSEGEEEEEEEEEDAVKEEVLPVVNLSSTFSWCLDCSLKFENYIKFQRHMVRQHGYEKKLQEESHVKCLRCNGQEFESCSLYTDHLIQTHNISINSFRVICGDCKKPFLFFPHRTNHRKKVHSLAPVPFKSIEKKPEIFGKEFKCNYCARIFFSMGRMVDHMKLKHSDQDYLELTRVQEYLAYKSAVDTQNKAMAQCPHCSKWFRRPSLKRHLLSHAEGTLPCHVCGKQLRPITLVKHLKRHEVKKSRPVLCSVCGASFPSREDLGIHSKVHYAEAIDGDEGGGSHIERNFSCDQCGKCFARDSTLYMHKMTVHDKKTAVVCEVCGKSCVSKGALKVHMLTHTDVREHKCDFCTFACKSKASFQYHMKRSHNTEDVSLRRDIYAKHRCEVCGRGYNVTSKYEKHMRRHNREEYKCPMCARVFVHKGNLRIHMDQHHNIKMPKGEDPYNFHKYIDESHISITFD